MEQVYRIDQYVDKNRYSFIRMNYLLLELATLSSDNFYRR